MRTHLMNTMLSVIQHMSEQKKLTTGYTWMHALADCHFAAYKTWKYASVKVLHIPF